MSNSSERLLQLTGGSDLTKNPSVTNTILQEVLTELQHERMAQAKDKARQLLQQCLELEKKKQQAKKDFEAAEKRFEKELGKLLSQLERNLGGHSPAEEVEESDLAAQMPTDQVDSGAEPTE
jgi:hypothetical protein